jgi:hypothetical protein
LSEGDEDFGELAKQFRQLAERFHRLGAVAFDSTSSAGFKRWGEDLMAQADALFVGLRLLPENCFGSFCGLYLLEKSSTSVF